MPAAARNCHETIHYPDEAIFRPRRKSIETVARYGCAQQHAELGRWAVKTG
jgi:hypothetical protein